MARSRCAAEGPLALHHSTSAMQTKAANARVTRNSLTLGSYQIIQQAGCSPCHPRKSRAGAHAANPCQARNSPPFGESSCLARICPCAKSRRVCPAIFTPIVARCRGPPNTLENPVPATRSPALPTPIFIPIVARARAPQQARNSPPFGESPCLARICPFAKPRRVPPIFIPIVARVRTPQQGRKTGRATVTPAVLPPVQLAACLSHVPSAAGGHAVLRSNFIGRRRASSSAG